MAADEATNSDHLEARVVDRCLKLHADRDRCNTLYEQHLRYKAIKRAIHQTASIICEIAPVVGDRDNYDTKLLELLYQRTIPDVEFLHKTTQLHGQLTMEVDKDLIMLICGAESTHLLRSISTTMSLHLKRLSPGHGNGGIFDESRIGLPKGQPKRES